VLFQAPIQAQNYAPLIKKANDAFQSGDFNTALDEYRQLLSKDTKNIDFNYKYATCLYNTSDINKATKFYDLILNMYDPPIDSYFYRGKIFQHNYDFQNAIKSFEKYKSLIGKKDVDLGADREINFCVNAQNQLKNIGSIKTLKRYPANRRDFYQTYKLNNTALSFISIDDLFTKQNLKKNYKPLIVSFRGMKYRFFASYGLDVRTGRDIYFQKKNEKNEWEEPMKLGSEVNSLGDEDFPFFDEQNGIRLEGLTYLK
jgi:tetratricopeptide (TPR) repeat protein